MIRLEPDVRELAARTLIEISHELIDGGYRVREADGRPTQFGNLSDLTNGNGFSALQVLAMLRAAASVGDERSAAEYRRLQSAGALDSLGTLVPWANVYARGGRCRFSHFGDDMAVFRNALTFWLVAGPEDELSFIWFLANTFLIKELREKTASQVVIIIAQKEKIDELGEGVATLGNETRRKDARIAELTSDLRRRPETIGLVSAEFGTGGSWVNVASYFVDCVGSSACEKNYTFIKQVDDPARGHDKTVELKWSCIQNGQVVRDYCEASIGECKEPDCVTAYGLQCPCSR